MTLDPGLIDTINANLANLDVPDLAALRAAANDVDGFRANRRASVVGGAELAPASPPPVMPVLVAGTLRLGDAEGVGGREKPRHDDVDGLRANRRASAGRDGALSGLIPP